MYTIGFVSCTWQILVGLSVHFVHTTKEKTENGAKRKDNFVLGKTTEKHNINI